MVETISRRRPAAEVSTSPSWGAFGVVLTVLVAGAFGTGWHFGRRWARVMGW
jgi:hypothetical protein